MDNNAKKILLSAPYMLQEGSMFDDFFREHNLSVTRADIIEHMSEEELLEVIEEFDGAICGDDPFTRAVFEKAKKLKVLCKWGTGINTIDLNAAAEFGVKVCNTPNAFSHPLAETVMGYMLNSVRNITVSTEEMKRGIWSKIRCFTLSERTLGIIGIGNVGTQVAKRAAAFGMRILGNDIRSIAPIILEQYGIEMVSKQEIYEQADFITIHCDLNETSYHLFDKTAFNAMKRKPFIINTARGGHIEHSALLYALKNKLISGAGLDVFETEPLPKDDELLTFENVFLAPHNSNSSPKYWNMVHKNTLKNLIENL
ncbi:MAG: C-terminal binding protein [Clostridiales bacterium]|jgi:phosphoglycerate dehydrogenase-like enzyme|nr:C-terminal binding protein [Clostridiales bacterium]